jgi:hypothetical protein
VGLSFHYKGAIRNLSLIGELTEEVQDICKSLHWNYRLWKKKRPTCTKKAASDSLYYTPDDIKGISLSPNECEPLFLTFLPNGNLCSPLKLMFNDPVTNDLMIEVIHVKTQFAGPDTHIALLKLLRYLKEKYFAELEVDDEGLYWKTEDEETLLSQFAKYNFALKTLTEALSDFKAKPGESVNSLADRLEELLRKRFGRGD